MFSRRRNPFLAAMTVALAALAGCGDVVVETHGWPWAQDWPWFWPEKPQFVASRDFFERVPVAGQGAIRVEAVNGSIVIAGETGAASVTVDAELRAGSNVSWRDAQEALGRLEVRVEDQSGEIVVRTLQPSFDGHQYVVDYTITVPIHLAVDVSQVNGHVNALDVGSPLVVAVTNGDASLSGLLGVASLALGNGTVDGTVSLEPGGEIAASTVHGDIDLRIPASTSAEVTALVGSGTIAWEDLVLRNLVQTSRSLTGTLGDGAGSIDLETSNGNIRLTGFGG